MTTVFNNVLVTGAAGFIGYHLSERLLREGARVSGIDNLNDYYDVRLKKDRLERLRKSDSFTFYQVDVANEGEMTSVFERGGFDVVVNLAAQAGVRYSLTNPGAYTLSNMLGFANVLSASENRRPDRPEPDW